MELLSKLKAGKEEEHSAELEEAIANANVLGILCCANGLLYGLFCKRVGPVLPYLVIGLEYLICMHASYFS